MARAQGQWPRGLTPIVRLADRIIEEDDPQDLVFRKVVGTGIAVLAVPVTPVSAFMAWLAMGRNDVAIVLLALTAFQALLVLLLLQRPGLFLWAIRGFVVSNLVVAFALTFALGGYVTSGANPTWGLFGPIIGGLLIHPLEGLFWFGVWAALAGISAWMDANVDVVTGGGPSIGVNTIWASFSILAMLFFFEMRRRRTEAALAEQRTRMRELLHDVLPSTIADRMLAGETRFAERFDDVSVCFLDLVGFTALSASLDAEELVDRLDVLFGRLDAAAARHGLVKIKTIGDAYMVAGGVPEPWDGHLEATARFALEALDIVGDGLQARVGLHAGPVVAGVIGEQRFAYDIWGDTVNMASRLESSGAPGRVQVTASTAARLTLPTEPRGTIELKGKGPTEVAWLSS